MALLEIEDLSVDFETEAGTLRAVDHVDLSVDAGQTLGVVGESGSGKSVSMLAVMGLLGPNARVSCRRMAFAGEELLALPPRRRRELTGRDMAMVFQDPLTSLNPCFTVGFQIAEAIAAHERVSAKARRARAIDLLRQVGIPAPETRLTAFPHQLSGGMNQRVMIAIAIACNPKLLIADEPTTALDVTVQAQILDLLDSLRRERGMAMVLITHDMGVVSTVADRVQVMYAGQVVEQRRAERIFIAPRHPYTGALLAALPEAAGSARLASIPGVVPGLHDRPRGCLFNPRCARADALCRTRPPALDAELADDPDDGRARCFHPLDAARPSSVAP